MDGWTVLTLLVLVQLLHLVTGSSLGEVRLTSSPLLHTVSSAPPSDQPSPEDDPFPRLSPAPPDPPGAGGGGQGGAVQEGGREKASRLAESAREERRRGTTRASEGREGDVGGAAGSPKPPSVATETHERRRFSSLPALNTQVAHGSLGEEAAHTSTPSVATPATSSVSPIALRPTLTPAVSSRSSNTQMPTTIGLGPASGKGASTATSPLSTPSTTFTTTATSTISMTSPNSTTSMTSPTSPASSPPTTSRTQRLDATPGEESLLEGQLRTLATPPTPESLPRQNLDAPGRPTRPSRAQRPLPSPTPTGGHTPGRSDEDKGFPMTPSPHPAAAVRLTKGVRSFISPQLARIWGAGEGEDEWKKANHEPSRARANAPPWMKIRRRRRRYPGDGGDEGNGSSDGALSASTPTPTATTPENRKSVSKAEHFANDSNSSLPTLRREGGGGREGGEERGGHPSQPPAHTPDRSKSTASQTELRTKLGAQEKDVMGEAKGRRNGGDGNTAIPGKYGGPSESFPVEMSVADRYEAGREGRRTPIDFKVTKTGDFGGFSVTKTEEVDPINGFSVTRTEVDPARGRVVVTKTGEGQRSSSGGSETSSGRQGLSRRVKPQDKLSPEAKASTSKAEEPSPRFRHRDPQPETSASKRERGKMEDKGGGNHAGGDKTPGRKENPDGKEETPDKTRVPQDDLESKLSRQVGSATVKPSTAERSRSKTQTDPKTQQKTSDSSDVTLRNSAMTPLSSTNGPLPPPTLRIHSRSSTLYPEANKTKQTQQVNTKAEEEVDVDASIFDLPVDEAGPESRLHYQREMSDRRRPPTAAPTRIFPVELLDEVEEQNPLPEEEERRREKNLPKSTTLSSVFSEELIPPLPNQWDDDWRNAGPSRSDTETERQSDSDDVPPYESGDRQPPDIQKEKQRTTKYQESPKASGGATSDRRRAEVRPALGKADLRASSWPGPGERVEFVTVVPGGHWDVWGGPTLWDSLTPHSNNSHTNPQVYSVYWGDTGGPGSPPGWPEGVWVIRGGSLLAIMALVVTISVQVARDGPAHRAVPTAADALARAHHSQHATLATNLATSLASAHVLLIFGIQATGKAWVCGVVGLLLHFLHLVSCCWLLALTVRLLGSLHQRRPIHTAVYCTASWGASLGLVVVSYVVNPDGYETRRYCWMSVERGMLVSFIVPVCSLILVNAGVCVAAQKVLLDTRDGVKHEVMTRHKRDLRGAVALLPLEGISWFLAVVALEDHQSLALDFAAAFVSAALGWLVLYFHGWTWSCHGLCWLRRHLATTRRVDDLSLPLTARYDHDLSHQPLLQPPTPVAHTAHHTVTVAPPPPTTPAHQTLVPHPEEFPLQPIFPQHERREVY